MNSREYETRERYRKAIDEMMHVVNDMGFNRRLFVEELERQHRTLQQKLFGAFLNWCWLLKENYTENHYYDLRNEASCEIATQIAEEILEPRHILKGAPLPYV